jgi:hypothetical protein
MKTPSENIVVPAVDGKKEAESKLAVPSGKKVPKKKTHKTATKKLAPKKVPKAVRKAARKATKTRCEETEASEFRYQRVLKMWKAGKTLETIAPRQIRKMGGNSETEKPAENRRKEHPKNGRDGQI